MNIKKKLLIFRIGSLGDTMVALPALHLLREKYPEHYFTLLTNSPVDGGIKATVSYHILNGSGLIDNYIEYKHNKLNIIDICKLILTIICIRPDHVIYLMPPRSFMQRARDALFFLLAGVFRVEGLFPGRYGNLHLATPDNLSWESEASRLVRSIGFNDQLLTQSLFTLKLTNEEYIDGKITLEELNTTNKFIALSVGTKVPANDWGTDRWIELLESLISLSDKYSLVFLGSQDEYQRCQKILGTWPHKSLNLCGKLTPRQSAAVLANSHIFVGHDSGPMHLASSVAIPVVSIFASRNKHGIWFPFGNEKNVFYTDVPCSNCKLSVCKDFEMICIRSIDPRKVSDKIKEVIL